MDQYDTAIEYLTEHPDEIPQAWDEPLEHPGGVLFMAACRSGEPGRYGCLTQIRATRLETAFFSQSAETEQITDKIAADDRIPDSPEAITLAHLPVFAEYQRWLDEELDRAFIQYEK